MQQLKPNATSSSCGLHSHFARRLIMSVATIALAASTLATTFQAQAGSPPREVRVTGQAQLEVPPDEASLSATFGEVADTADEALDALEDKFAPLQRQLQRDLPKQARLVADSVIVRPEIHWEDGESERIGMRAERTIRLEHVPLAQAGELLKTLVAANPERLNQPSYQASDIKSQRDEVIKAALLDAKQRAELMASTLNEQLGHVMSIQEISTPQLGAPRNESVMMMKADSARAAAPELNPGQQTLNAQIEVVFELD